MASEATVVDKESVYRILSIDGGGVFGIIPAMAISMTTTDLSNIDMFAGTSVGSELALAYASGIAPQFVLEEFDRMVHSVFQRGIWRRMNRVRRPKYSDKYLNAMLQALLTKKLGEIEPHVVIPTKNLADDRFKVWDNIVEHDDIETPAWEVARMSSAAPTYFSPWKGYIDGGWCANNPTLIAVMAAISKANIPLNRIRVLSLGTGHGPKRSYDPNKMCKWGPVKFLKPLIDGVTKSNEQPVEYQMSILKSYLEGYERFDPITLHKTWEMDDPKSCELLKSRIRAYGIRMAHLWEWFVG
jgi:patatin-like phospholipase/acyl hydrolase